MKAGLLDRTGIEMSGDPVFLRRVRRLAGVSSIALGIIWLLAVANIEPHHSAIEAALLAGWILMPTVLWTSIRRPEVRPMVLIPSALVTSGLVALCLTALPTDFSSRAGWLLITGGILFGGMLGAWFWFRWIPVPSWLDAPFSPGRWALVGAHVAMITSGIILVVGGSFA